MNTDYSYSYSYRYRALYCKQSLLFHICNVCQCLHNALPCENTTMAITLKLILTVKLQTSYQVTIVDKSFKGLIQMTHEQWQCASTMDQLPLDI